MLINDVRDFRSKNNNTRIEIKGTNTLGRDLGAPTVAPKCTVFFLSYFLPLLVMYLPVFSIRFTT